MPWGSASADGCIFGKLIRAARTHRRLAITQIPSRWSPHTSSSTRRFQEPRQSAAGKPSLNETWLARLGMGFVLVAAVFTMMVYLIVDLLQFMIDPRISARAS